MIRRLRIATSYACFVLCVVFAASWAESQNSIMLARCNVAPRHSFRVHQIFAEIHLKWHGERPTTFSADWKYVNSNASKEIVESLREAWKTSTNKPDTTFGFYADYKPDHLQFVMPHWIAVLIMGLLAILLRPTPRWQCGLREVFAVTTMVAVAVAGFVLCSRYAVEWPDL